MKSVLLYFIVSLSGLLFYGSINAQVKTKIYYDGVPTEKLEKILNNEVEIKITPPASFEKLLAEENVEDDNREYKNRFALPVKLNIDVLDKANKLVYFKNQISIRYLY